MPSRLHLRDRLAAGAVALRGQDLPGVLQRRLDDADRTSTAYVGDSRSSSSIAASANGDSGWLSAKSGWRSTVSRSVRPVAVRRVEPFDDAGRQQAFEDLVGLGQLTLLHLRCLGGARRSAPRARRSTSPGPGEQVDEHRVADPELAGQLLRLAGDEPLVGRRAPRRPCPRAASSGRPCGASWGRRRPWPAPSRSR